MPEWCELRTAEFEMYSAMPKRQMVSLASSLQALHSIAVDLVPGEFPKRSRLKIIAFEDINSFVAEFQSDAFIGFMQPSMRQHVLAFGLAVHTTHPNQVAYHEYTHYISRSRYDYFIPMWYEEGFAQYLGTFEVASDRVTIGEVSHRRMIRAIRRNEPKWRTILDGVPRLDWHEHDYAAHYEFAHAVTHFMHHGVDETGNPMREKVNAILLDISNGARASELLPRSAGVEPEQFMQTLIDHFRKTRPLSYRIDIDTNALSAISEPSCMSELDARILLASILVRNNPERALSHIDRGMKIDADHPMFQVLWSYLPGYDSKTPYERTLRALELDPTNVDAHVRMGDLLSYNCLDVFTEECDNLRRIATQHYRHALNGDPLRVDAAFGLGVSLLRSARAGDGLNYLKVAYERLPWNARINLFLGDAYKQIGNNNRASFHLNRAIMWEIEEAVRQRAIEMMN